MKKIFAFLLGMGAIFTQVFAAPQAVSPEEARTWLAEKKAVMIDVREDNEFKQQHIPNAIHIPLGQLPQRLAELAPYKETIIIAQCRSGHRSQQAIKILQSSGFSNLYNLEGGILAWHKAGLNIE